MRWWAIYKQAEGNKGKDKAVTENRGKRQSKWVCQVLIIGSQLHFNPFNTHRIDRQHPCHLLKGNRTCILGNLQKFSSYPTSCQFENVIKSWMWHPKETNISPKWKWGAAKRKVGEKFKQIRYRYASLSILTKVKNAFGTQTQESPEKGKDLNSLNRNCFHCFVCFYNWALLMWMEQAFGNFRPSKCWKG